MWKQYPSVSVKVTKSHVLRAVQYKTGCYCTIYDINKNEVVHRNNTPFQTIEEAEEAADKEYTKMCDNQIEDEVVIRDTVYKFSHMGWNCLMFKDTGNKWVAKVYKDDALQGISAIPGNYHDVKNRSKQRIEELEGERVCIDTTGLTDQRPHIVCIRKKKFYIIRYIPSELREWNYVAFNPELGIVVSAKSVAGLREKLEEVKKAL